MTAKRLSGAGFTIVETLIVLTIAAFILLIIFEALPALQRNSRNNQRKQDVQSILEAVSHWELNSSGNIPGSGDNFLQYSKLTYYNPGSVTGCGDHSGSILICGNQSGNPPSESPETSIEKVDIYNYQKCSTATPGGSTATGAGYSDVVALYAVETLNGVSSQCQQL